MKKKLIISLIAVILVLGVAFAIGALVKENKDTLQDMIIRIESAIKEVLGDDVKKQTETVVAGTLKYADKEGNEINYHILKTTYYEADPSEITGLNVDALGVLINPDSANRCKEMKIKNWDALKRKILNINPKANVKTFGGIIQNIPKEILDEMCTPFETIFVGCGDNRAADVYANKIAIYFDAAFISIGFWERAYAGEIFYHIPHKNMPCYQCALGSGDMSGRVEANHHVYSNQENIENLKFEPGISVDINFITSVGIKLIIDILNSTNEGYIPRLLNNLQQYTLICNTSDPAIGGEMVEIFSYPLQVTTSFVVGFGKDCNGECNYELEEK